MKANNDMFSLGDYMRRQGRNGDSVLAHINPEEANMLEGMGGSGTTNPYTGLPEYYTTSGSPLSNYKPESAMGFASLFDPTGIMAAGSAASGLYNTFFKKEKKPKEKTGHERGMDDFEYMMASEVPARHKAEYEKDYNKHKRLNEDEIYDEANYKNRLERAEWEARNNLGRGETLNVDPLYRKENDDEEFKKSGRRFDYYNNSDFKGNRLYMAEGGQVKHPSEEHMEIEIMQMPHTHKNKDRMPSLMDLFSDYEDEEDNFTSGYVRGGDGGHDDTIEARLSPGEYIVTAQDVSHLGDGNSENGARKLDEFFKTVRKHKRNSSIDEISPSMIEYRGR